MIVILELKVNVNKYDFSVTKKWSTIKCKVSPGFLHSHIACKLPNSMIVFGGERNGRLVNEFWKFQFGKCILSASTAPQVSRDAFTKSVLIKRRNSMSMKKCKITKVK